VHKIGANINSKLAVAHLLCKKPRALGGWVDVEGGLRIAYSNQKGRRHGKNEPKQIFSRENEKKVQHYNVSQSEDICLESKDRKAEGKKERKKERN
jgi:hypothetical protein